MTHLTHNPDLTTSVIYGLGWVYLLMFLMNAVGFGRNTVWPSTGSATFAWADCLAKARKFPTPRSGAVYAGDAVDGLWRFQFI